MFKKIFFLSLLILLFSLNSLALAKNDPGIENTGVFADKLVLIDSIETGKAAAEVFLYAIEHRYVDLLEISPQSVANYLEAFADEGLLEIIPNHYFEDQDVRLSLEIVFQDPENICKNQGIYEAQLR
ncbi:MAG: hypothetical protein JRJ03_06055 [Deltaproteobacteria bacterium]|nr:hypothetical protein [Deltaproteobacteria bacterium]